MKAQALVVFFAAALAAAPLAAQELQVERISLAPGQSASFTLAPGFSHQLLRRAARRARGAITVRYEVGGGRSIISAVSRAGRTLTFSVLADPDGNGGFSGMGEIVLPGDGTLSERSWPGALGTVNIGDFRPAAPPR